MDVIKLKMHAQEPKNQVANQVEVFMACKVFLPLDKCIGERAAKNEDANGIVKSGLKGICSQSCLIPLVKDKSLLASLWVFSVATWKRVSYISTLLASLAQERCESF